MAKSRNRKGHNAAVRKRRFRSQHEEILHNKQMQKFIDRQQETYLERYNLNDSLGNLKEVELADSKTKNYTAIEEFVQSIEDAYTRGFFSGRLSLLDDGIISAQEFVNQLEEAIVGKLEEEAKEELEEVPAPQSVDNEAGMHEDVQPQSEGIFQGEFGGVVGKGEEE